MKPEFKEGLYNGVILMHKKNFWGRIIICHYFKITSYRIIFALANEMKVNRYVVDLNKKEFCEKYNFSIAQLNRNLKNVEQVGLIRILVSNSKELKVRVDRNSLRKVA